MNNVTFNTKLQNAYDSVIFIKNKHGNQTRIGGDPYYTHPLAVGEILCNKGYVNDIML